MLPALDLQGQPADGLRAGVGAAEGEVPGHHRHRRGRRAAEAGADRELGVDAQVERRAAGLAQRLGRLAERDLDDVRRIAAAHRLEGGGAGLGGVALPALADLAGVGEEVAPGELLAVADLGEIELDAAGEARGEAGGEAAVHGRDERGAAVDGGVLADQDELAGSGDATVGKEDPPPRSLRRPGWAPLRGRPPA